MVAETSEPIPVASLLCQRHVALACTCLGSLLHHAQADLDLTLFDDGTLDDRDLEQLRHSLPTATIIPATRSEACMGERLSVFPNCAAARAVHPILRKLLDIPLQMRRSYLYCDADVLFLRPFSLETVRPRLDSEYLFLRDIREGYSAGLRQFIVHRQLPLISKANAGFGSVPWPRYDLDFAEWFLGVPQFRVFPDMLEQTCWALMPAGRGVSIFDDRQLFCYGHGRALDEETIGVHFIGPAKDRVATWQQRAAAQFPGLRPVAELRLHRGRTANFVDVVTSGLRNRLLPPAWR